MQPSRSTLRYGGDKLAFKAGSSSEGQDKDTIAAISRIIDAAKDDKQERRQRIEQKKEKEIDDGEQAAKQKLDNLQHQVLSPVAADLERSKISEEKIKRAKKTLGDYHDAILRDGGWHWRDIKSAILRLQGVNIDEVQTGTDSGVALVRSARGTVLYTISFGRSRFGYDSDEVGSTVYTKTGSVGDPGKQFVRDRNGVMTRRFVTRAVTIYQMVGMFGLKIIPPAMIPDPIDNDLAAALPSHLVQRLCRKMDDVAKDPTVELALDERDRVLAEQLPRYVGRSFAGHGDVFDLRRAACYEPDAHLNPDFVPYRTRGAERVSVGDKTGFVLTTGFCEGRTRNDSMQGNERASMQVRNGTGPFQPYLSAASIQVTRSGEFVFDPYKVIRANKGERFDTGAENQGTVLLDLRIAKELNVDIVNQHAPESDKYKIAYDRYYDKGDIVALERKVAHRLYEYLMAGTLKATLGNQLGGSLQTALLDAGFTDPFTARLDIIAAHAARVQIMPWHIGIDPKEFDGLSADAIGKIMALKGNEVDVTKEKIKRRAAEELDEYIYSARKNREVLMDRIPLACVTHIKLNADKDKWPGFGGSVRGTWYKREAIEDDLRRYLTYGLSYPNIREMFKIAAKAKQDELGRT